MSVGRPTALVHSEILRFVLLTQQQQDALNQTEYLNMTQCVTQRVCLEMFLKTPSSVELIVVTSNSVSICPAAVGGGPPCSDAPRQLFYVVVEAPCFFQVSPRPSSRPL